MYNESEFRFLIPVEETDLSTANTLFTWTVGKKFLLINVSAFLVTGTGATVAIPVLEILHNGTEKIDITLAANEGIGTEVMGAAAGTTYPLPLDIAATDTLAFAVKTAATSVTTGALYYVIYGKEQP